MQPLIEELIEYAKIHLGLDDLDAIYAKNQIFALLGISFSEEKTSLNLDKIRKTEVPDYYFDEFYKYFINTGKNEKEAEILATKIMGMVTPAPSVVEKRFLELEKEDSAKALDYLYQLSIHNYYFQKTKVDKNIVWKTNFDDKNIEISINLSKPEKNNKDIAKLLAKPNPSEVKYPKCLLCKENLGFEGNANHPARQNIRFITLNLDNEKWYLQYSPYGYFYKHCIALSEKHENMFISESTFRKLADFVDRFPSFFIGSNADLPIVGGSILNHEHFQGGEHILPVMEAGFEKKYPLKNYKNAKLYKLNWYNSTLVVKGKDKKEVTEVAGKILNAWRKHSDLENEIIASDKDGEHNTITSAMRKVNGEYNLYLILRNNRCNEKYPDGIFHAHSEYHHIKKEGIGIIEAMGLYILPARLVRQESEIKDVLALGLDNKQIVEKYADLADFLGMIDELRTNYSAKTIDEDINKYIEKVCINILENTAVYKKNEVGNKGLDNFVEGINL